MMFYREFFCTDPLLIKTIKDEVKNITPSLNVINQMCAIDDAELNYSYYNNQLFEWFGTCIEDIRKTQYINGVDLVITECWANRTPKFKKHHLHTHPNSIISGIFYLTEHKNATTDFYIPNPWAFTDSIFMVCNNKEEIISIEPVVGKLVLFPSNIKHCTRPNLTNDVRMTLAFNTFFTGRIGKQSSLMNINATSVKDCHDRKK